MPQRVRGVGDEEGAGPTNVDDRNSSSLLESDETLRVAVRAESVSAAAVADCRVVEMARFEEVHEPNTRRCGRPTRWTTYPFDCAPPITPVSPTSDLYDRIADLPLVVDGSHRTTHESDTTSEFVRTTTVFALAGNGDTGRGEDVTYDTEDHDALDGVEFDFTGTYTFDEFSSMLDDTDLFPAKEPERDTGYPYRRWAVESAALDLALKQTDTNFATALDLERHPTQFVVSTRLPEPDDGGTPSRGRVEALLDAHPDTELKLDPTSAWGQDTVEALAATDAVRILDLKGQYHGTIVDQEPNPDLYHRVGESFPDAILEDPALTDETEAVLDGVERRVSWDAPVTGVESVENLPFDPSWLNIKPSRFGTVKSLLDTTEYAFERGIRLYGGGQFELDVGREHIQTLASVLYPNGPNDVAPRAYNRPDGDLAAAPASPLTPSTDPSGLSF